MNGAQSLVKNIYCSPQDPLFRHSTFCKVGSLPWMNLIYSQPTNWHPDLPVLFMVKVLLSPFDEHNFVEKSEGLLLINVVSVGILVRIVLVTE
jgi:hypothetical protein